MWIKIKHKGVLHKSRQNHNLEKFRMKFGKSDVIADKTIKQFKTKAQKYEQQIELIFSYEIKRKLSISTYKYMRS